MTREQLDAIRAVLAECRRLGWTTQLVDDAHALLAEVERLTVERDEACRSREEARAYRDISAKALQEESERHAVTRSQVQATLGVLWERGRIARGMHAATAGTALAETVTEVFDRLDRARGEVERLTADPLPAAAWVREVERAAFQRGVAAMREAVVKSVTCRFPTINAGGNCGLCTFCDDALDIYIRALPDPEDK